MDHWPEVIGASAPIAIAALGCVRYWLRTRGERARHRALDMTRRAIARRVQIRSLISDARRDMAAQRVLVLRAENGGGIPRGDGDLHSSVIYESCQDDLEPVAPRWKDQLMDGEYMSVLLKVLSNRVTRVVTSELPAGDLRDVYVAGGTVWSKVVLLDVNAKRMLYMSFTFDEEPPEDTIGRAKLRDSVRATATAVRTLLLEDP